MDEKSIEKILRNIYTHWVTYVQRLKSGSSMVSVRLRPSWTHSAARGPKTSLPTARASAPRVPYSNSTRGSTIVHSCCSVLCGVRCKFCKRDVCINKIGIVVKKKRNVLNIQTSWSENIGVLPTQGLSLQRPHFLCGGSKEALKTFNNWKEVGDQQLMGSIGWKDEEILQWDMSYFNYTLIQVGSFFTSSRNQLYCLA